MRCRMAMVMVTIHAPDKAPTVDEMKKRFDLKPGELDERFGIVKTDRDRGEYTVLVDQEAAAKIRPDQNWRVTGPYSNPKIETFEV